MKYRISGLSLCHYLLLPRELGWGFQLHQNGNRVIDKIELGFHFWEELECFTGFAPLNSKVLGLFQYHHPNCQMLQQYIQSPHSLGQYLVWDLFKLFLDMASPLLFMGFASFVQYVQHLRPMVNPLPFHNVCMEALKYILDIFRSMPVCLSSPKPRS